MLVGRRLVRPTCAHHPLGAWPTLTLADARGVPGRAPDSPTGLVRECAADWLLIACYSDRYSIAIRSLLDCYVIATQQVANLGWRTVKLLAKGAFWQNEPMLEATRLRSALEAAGVEFIDEKSLRNGLPGEAPCFNAFPLPSGAPEPGAPLSDRTR